MTAMFHKRALGQVDRKDERLNHLTHSKIKSRIIVRGEAVGYFFALIKPVRACSRKFWLV